MEQFEKTLREGERFYFMHINPDYSTNSAHVFYSETFGDFSIYFNDKRFHYEIFDEMMYHLSNLIIEYQFVGINEDLYYAFTQGLHDVKMILRNEVPNEDEEPTEPGAELIGDVMRRLHDEAESRGKNFMDYLNE